MEAILSPFVKRFSQPIILSFILAWIFWNWEIVVALIWYNQETMNKLPGKKTNYIEYINSLKDPWKLYWGPIISAFAYPFVVLIANNFNATIRRADTWLFLKISKGSSVPTSMYLDAQEDIDRQEKRISRFITEETSLRSKLASLEEENLRATTSNQTLGEDLNLLQREFSDRNVTLKQVEEELAKIRSISTKNHTYSLLEYWSGRYKVEIFKGDTFPDSLVYDKDMSVLIKKQKGSGTGYSLVYNDDYKSESITSEINMFAYNIHTNNIILNTEVIVSPRVPSEILRKAILDTTIQLNIDDSKDLLFGYFIHENVDYRVDLIKIK